MLALLLMNLGTSSPGHADAIELRYFMMELPRLPDEANPFVDQFLKEIDKSTPAAAELKRLRHLILATYGEEPEDAVVKAHVAGQSWYAPREDFNMETLSKTQKAVLKKLDDRIAVAGGK